MNLNRASDAILEALVRHGLRHLLCSIDGACQETYARYRVGGDFSTVIANIRKLNAFKARYRSQYPNLAWQFVVFGHNEHEIPAARALAEELGMAFRLKLSWDPDFSPVRDREALRRQLGAADRTEYRERFSHVYAAEMCWQLWDRPQVNWDGKMLGCCRNFWGEFGGNAFRDGLDQAINSEGMRYARGILTGRQPPRDDIPCTTCEIYEDMQRRGRFLRDGRAGRILRRATRRLGRLFPRLLGP